MKSTHHHHTKSRLLIHLERDSLISNAPKKYFYCISFFRGAAASQFRALLAYVTSSFMTGCLLNWHETCYFYEIFEKNVFLL